MSSAGNKEYVTPSYGIGPSSPVGPEEPLQGIRSSMGWQNAWMTAIALAWSDEKLGEELIADPADFFRKHCKYQLPDGLTVRVAYMPQEDSAGKKTGWDPATKLWYLKNTEVTMFLPPPPPLEERSVALSAYSAAGRSYPFTSP